MKLITRLLLISVLISGLVSAQDNIVEIATGTLEGNVFSTHREFLGIPFGEPPIGSLRWASPIPVKSLGGGVYDATYQRAGCPQQCGLPAGVCPTVTDENCLFLDIYTPSMAEASEPLPVMFFIPGGRYEMGAANTVIYNSTVVVNTTNVIVVSINYRLGALGFLVSDNFAGNYGFEDQVLALQWVQDNIKAFGGDPTQVTVYGESAGGTSSSLHLTSPASAGMFSKLIIQSNPWSLPVKSIAELKAHSEKFSSKLGCTLDNSNCLLNATVEDILNAQNSTDNSFDILAPLLTFLPWTPVVDGKLILDQPITLIQKGQYNKVPVMVGTVHSEALLFVASIALDINKVEFIGGLIDIYGLETELKVNRLYEPLQNTSSDNYMDLLARIGTDYIFVCPSRNAAANLAKWGTEVFYYQFQHHPSFNPYGSVYPFCADAGVVCHGLELPFIFDTASLENYQFTPEEQDLSFQMINYWSNFAKNGNPNIGSPIDVQWPTYSSDTDDMMTFDTPSYTQTGYIAEYCDFWDPLGYTFGY